MPDIEARLNEALTGRYSIERELGEGGMATVYLARDLRHNRNVAIKVLKPELAAVVGAERFLAEIETTANLQHPHILPLFDSGEADGFLFYVMPYVEGETLRDRIDRERQLPVDEAVGVAIAIANALQTAHEQGIVHRDIKPANILLSRGEPLVADFGIAIAVHAGGGGRMTETGLSLGTPYYMSPEQATGDQSIGPAADIYALGSVLYEMLIGEPPYQGNSAQAVLGKIIQGAPPSATATRRSIPLNVDGAIFKALEKLPADRFASAGDFVNALTNPSFRYGLGAETSAATGGRSWARVAGALGVTTLLFGAVAAWALMRPTPTAEFNQLELAIDEAVSNEISLGVRGRLSLSPDGRRIVFVGEGGDFQTQLWVRDLSQLEARPIPGTEGATNPSISPDGLDVAFTTFGSTGRQLRRIPLDGGPSVLLSDSLIDLGGVSWGMDGWIYTDAALEGDGFARVPETGGSPEIVTTPVGEERWHAAPHALPNGRGVLFFAAGVEKVSVVDLDTGEHRALVDGVWGAYSETGHLIWVTREGRLMAQAFDPDRFELSGRSVPLAEDLVRPNAIVGGSATALSRAGQMLYLTGGAANEPTPLIWVDRSGETTPFDSTWVRSFSQVALSPDGSQLVTSIDEEVETQLWVRPTDGGPARRLTLSGSQSSPTWLPDGEWVGYAAAGGIFRRRADGTGGEIQVHQGVGLNAPVWTRDGQWLVYVRQGAIYGQPLNADGLAEGEAVVLVDDTPAYEGHPRISPDGQRLAFMSLFDGVPRVYVRPFPETDQGNWVSDQSAVAPQWSEDGTELFFLDWPRGSLRSVTLQNAEAFSPSAPSSLFRWDGFKVENGGLGAYALDADGERVLMMENRQTSETERLVLIQNLPALLNERVGN